MTAWEHLNGTGVDGGPFAVVALTFWPPTEADHSMDARFVPITVGLDWRL